MSMCLVVIVVAYAMVHTLQMGHAGLALATSAVALFSFLVLFQVLKVKIGGIHGRRLRSLIGKVSVASAVMGVAVGAVLVDASNTAGPAIAPQPSGHAPDRATVAQPHAPFVVPTVPTLPLFARSDAGAPQIAEATPDAGTLTVNSVVTAHGDGNLTLNADLAGAALNAAVSSTTGDILLTANTMDQNAGGDFATGTSGTVTVTADSGAITMADGTTTTSGSGTISYSATASVVLGLLTSTSGEINVTAGSGASGSCG